MILPNICAVTQISPGPSSLLRHLKVTLTTVNSSTKCELSWPSKTKFSNLRMSQWRAIPKHQRVFTWAIKQNIVILHVPKALLQPAEVIGKVFHAKHQATIGAKPQGLIFHDIVHFYQLADVCDNTTVTKSQEMNSAGSLVGEKTNMTLQQRWVQGSPHSQAHPAAKQNTLSSWNLHKFINSHNTHIYGKYFPGFIWIWVGVFWGLLVIVWETSHSPNFHLMVLHLLTNLFSLKVSQPCGQVKMHFFYHLCSDTLLLFSKLKHLPVHINH